MSTPLINGMTYSWSDITVNLFGLPVQGIKAINYIDDQKMENIKGAGRKPVARALGDIEYNGSITLDMKELAALQKAAPNGRIQEIPEFDIPVKFLNAAGDMTIHTLKSVRFMRTGVDARSGDMEIPVELPLIIGDIKWK